MQNTIDNVYNHRLKSKRTLGDQLPTRGSKGARGLGLNNDGLPPNRELCRSCDGSGCCRLSTWPGGWLFLQASLCIKPPCIYAPRKNSSRACARQGGFAISRASSPCLVPALAAVLFLAVSVWLAPSHKKVVTRVVFIGGCAVALYLAWLTAAWGSFLAAVTRRSRDIRLSATHVKRDPSAKLPDRPGVANVAFCRRASIRTRMWHPARDVLASEPLRIEEHLTQL